MPARFLVSADELSTCHTLTATRELLQFAPRWIHRNVTKFEFADVHMLRGQTSIDFSVPSFDPAVDERGAPQVQASRLHVPLAFVPHGKLARIDLRDESNRAIPALNLREERELTLAIMFAVWSELLGRASVRELASEESARATKVLVTDPLN